MTIQEYVASAFMDRLERSPTLVIYDGENRFREGALGLADQRITVVDAEMPVFQAREQAVDAWLALPAKPDARLVVYVPRAKPVDAPAKLVDPYLVYRVSGAVFPEGASDEYAALCQQAFPDRAEQIQDLFADGVPDFATVNALAGGPTWPRLRTLTGAESIVEILSALLAPSADVREKLENDSSWRPEARELIGSALRHELPPGDEPLAALSRRLWQLVLFSEFALDLPGGLPPALQDVPRIPPMAGSSVRRLCASLRDRVHSQGTYVEHAQRVERELGLAEHLRDSMDLGSLETFPFENAVTFRRVCAAVVERRIEEAVSLEQANRHSIWRQYSPSHQMAWQLAILARDIIADSDKLLRDTGAMAPQTAADAVNQYVTRLSYIDRTYLSLHHVWAGMPQDEAFGLSLHGLVEATDAAYRKLADAVQRAFIAAVMRSSWPASGCVRQVEVYNRFVQPALDKEGLTAYVLVDALRMDLARDLERVLPAGLVVLVHPACAQLPTKTEVGMAALLPQAAGNLSLSARQEGLTVTVADQDVTTAASRDEYYRRLWGDRCAVIEMAQLLDMGPRKRLPESVRLVVVRDRAIDVAGEADGKRFPAALPAAMNRIGKAIHKLRSLGVRRAIVAADHGFIFAPTTGPGDVVAKPGGDWIVAKDRFLLGRGQGSDQVMRVSPPDVGVPCDVESVVFPRSLGTFTAGVSYCHGGLALQEAVIPVTCIDMPETGRKPPKRSIVMTYRGKESGRITSRVFTVDLSCPATALIQEDWAEEKLQIHLKVHGGDADDEVGRVMTGDHVDPSTLLVKLSSGESLKVPLRMDDEFRGHFTVKALDPVSSTRLAQVILETAYLE